MCFCAPTSLLEDSSTPAVDLGSPVARGSSFDIAASSVLPPYGNDLSSIPSFSEAVAVIGNEGSTNNDVLGNPLSRMHSLEYYSYLPAWTAPVSSVTSSNGTGKGEAKLATDFLSKVSAASSIPLLEGTPRNSDKPLSSVPSLSGVKRPLGMDSGDGEGALSSAKKIKHESTSDADSLTGYHPCYHFCLLVYI